MTISGGPIPSAPLVNPQAQMAQGQAARIQPPPDGIGTKTNAGARQPREAVGQATAGANARYEQDGPKRAEKNEDAKEAMPAYSQMDLEEAVETFREYLNKLPSDLNFNYDRDAGRHFFKIVNPVTGEVVKQFPTDEFLTMVKRLKDSSPSPMGDGVLLDGKF